MQQTLLVLLGVILLGIFSLARHEGYAMKEDSQVRREIETVALDVFDRWKGHLTSLPFDECLTLAMGEAGDCSIGTEMYGLTAHPLFSALPLQSDSGENGFSTYDDFDDFSGYDQTHEYLVRGEPLRFRVRVSEVRYVNPTEPWLTSSVRTTAKQARLSVYYEPTRADSVDTRPIGMGLPLDDDGIPFGVPITITADGSSF